jgi:hypothetical protein
LIIVNIYTQQDANFKNSIFYIVAYLPHARTVTSIHVPAITQQQTKRCFLRAESSSKHLDDARVRRSHVTPACSAVTQE